MKKIGKVERKHREFAKQYVINSYNATKAYIAVYQNDNKDTASANSSKLLKNPKVQQYIEEFENEPLASRITKDDVVNDILKTRNAAFAAKKYADVLRADELIARMLGYTEPEKVKFAGIIQFKFGQIIENVGE